MDGNKSAYLLLHVHVPSDRSLDLEETGLDGIEAAQKAGKLLRIKLWTLRLDWSANTRGNFRYFFRFSRCRRDDQRAQLIGECFLHALALTFGPFMDSNEVLSVYRVPAGLVHKSGALSGDKLVQIEEARDYGARILEFPRRTLGGTFTTASQYFDSAWKITPVLVNDENLYRAVRFLKASQDDFFVWPGQINDVLGDPDSTALTGFEQIYLENALQNAFKSIEAVLGDPPKDDSKLLAKMEAVGLEADEEVGFSHKIPIYKVIRQMNKARDKKAAHGSTPNRKITIGEMMEYQACARYVAWVAIENRSIA